MVQFLLQSKDTPFDNFILFIETLQKKKQKKLYQLCLASLVQITLTHKSYLLKHFRVNFVEYIQPIQSRSLQRIKRKKKYKIIKKKLNEETQITTATKMKKIP